MIYGQLVESDQLYSPKTGKWYEVLSVSTSTTEARVRLAGVGKLLVKPIKEEIRPEHVRRGQTGGVMDLFITIFSGETK